MPSGRICLALSNNGERNGKKLPKAEIKRLAHENWLEHTRKLLRGAGFVQGPGDTWTAASMGKRGGKARAKNLSKKQLSEIGKQGAAKRWGKEGGKA
jgi:hypothetical protein